ncbi:hypothetical protein AKJ16_DCAP27226, partial [Drosera capensis]
MSSMSKLSFNSLAASHFYSPSLHREDKIFVNPSLTRTSPRRLPFSNSHAASHPPLLRPRCHLALLPQFLRRFLLGCSYSIRLNSPLPRFISDPRPKPDMSEKTETMEMSAEELEKKKKKEEKV